MSAWKVRDYLLGVWCALLLAAAALAIWPGWTALVAWACSQRAVEWFTAIATVGAVAAALLVPHIQAAREARTAQSLAINRLRLVAIQVETCLRAFRDIPSIRREDLVNLQVVFNEALLTLRAIPMETIPLECAVRGVDLQARAAMLADFFRRLAESGWIEAEVSYMRSYLEQVLPEIKEIRRFVEAAKIPGNRDWQL